MLRGTSTPCVIRIYPQKPLAAASQFQIISVMSVGKVYLVGAGPGDPGLLTLKGKACLQEADLVLYDGLVNPAILRHSPAVAERTSRMVGPDGKRLDQEAINQRLVEAGLAGKVVVRLKGGDPYIFGRGTEEAAALREAGVPFEVVPGITAATAAGEYAGISVTHRRMSSAVAFVTGHEDPTKPGMLDYHALAQFPGTLVFYMGLARLPKITASLLEYGKPGSTPACVVSRASRARQRTVSATLETVADEVASADLSAPSLIIIGECATQRDALKWFEHKPLFGKRIGVTRDPKQAEPTIRRIHELGGEAVLMPLLEIQPPDSYADLDDAIRDCARFDWLAFTSANAVRAFCHRLDNFNLDARWLSSMKIAAVGTATAAALAEHRLVADLIPETQNAEGLADAMIATGHVDSVLWPRGNRGRETLRERLQSAGSTVHAVEVYRTAAATLSSSVRKEIESSDTDWITLGSPSMVQSLIDANVAIPESTRFAAISPLTEAAAQESGLTVSATATDFDWSGLIQAIVECEANDSEN